MRYRGICNLSESEKPLLLSSLDMHFYLSLSYLRQINFTIGKIWQEIYFLKSKKVLLMFCKSEAGI